VVASCSGAILLVAVSGGPAARAPESSAPPPPDDRPYDPKLLRLAEILGAVHYLRELCGAQEGQLWRNQMKELLRYEGSTAIRRAKLVNSFNDGYRGYRRTYRTCTSSAAVAISRFIVEGGQITSGLSKTTASREPATEAAQDGEQGASPPEPGDAKKPQGGAEANAAAKPPEANTGAGASGESASPAPQAKPAEGQTGTPQEGTSSSTPQAGTGEAGQAGEAEQQPAPRRKVRRARKAPPPRPGWFPLINQ
jgi:uncharacterized protein (TIGR02301 family)